MIKLLMKIEMALGSWIVPHNYAKKTISDKAFDKDLERERQMSLHGVAPDSGGEETVGEDPAHLPLHQAHLSPRQPSHRPEMSPYNYNVVQMCFV